MNLGYIYEYGRLGEENAEQALELFEQAAFCEHPEALYKLGDMLYWRNIDVEDESAADIQAFALYGKAHRLAQGAMSRLAGKLGLQARGLFRIRARLCAGLCAGAGVLRAGGGELRGGS